MPASGLMIYHVNMDQPNAEMQRMNGQMNDLDVRHATLNGKLDYLLLRSRSITSLFFNVLKDSSALRVAEAGLSIAMTGISMHRAYLQASAAFALGNVGEGSLLLGIAAAMGANQGRAIIIQTQMKLQEQRIEEMRIYTEAYE
jgi:hypothetical protein